MTVSKSFTFYSKNINDLAWQVTNAAGAVVNNAAVTATLYAYRDRIKPDSIPGIACPDFTNVSLIFNSVTNNYEASIPATFDVPTGGDYVYVVDVGDGSGTMISHEERPAVVLPSGP